MMQICAPVEGAARFGTTFDDSAAALALVRDGAIGPSSVKLVGDHWEITFSAKTKLFPVNTWVVRVAGVLLPLTEDQYSQWVS